VNIDILLATFNPDLSFLRKQLTSICNQEYDYSKCNVNLLIYDDASQNQKDVLLLLDEFKSASWTIQATTKNVGFVKAYSHLIQQSSSDLIFICDQDDIWDDSKIKTFLTAYLKLKSSNIPTVFYSDARCIDENDKIINNSHLSHMGYNGSKTQCQFFLKNYVPGCSIAFNKRAKELYLSTENYIELHDYLLILIAIIYGSLVEINQVTMSYRFHQNNTIGKKRRKNRYILKDIYYSFRYFFERKRYHQQHVQKTKLQLSYFYDTANWNLQKNFETEYVLLTNIEKRPYAGNYSQFISGADLGERCIEKMLFTKII
jgi:rhamnosyltransferase